MYPTIDDQYQKLNADDKKIYDKLLFSESIEGWLLLSEIVELYHLITMTTRRPAVFVEIGTWMGKSASIMGKAALDRGDAVVYGIDPFTGIGDPVSEKEYQKQRNQLNRTQQEECEHNLQQAGVQSAVRLLPFTSTNAKKYFLESKIDGLFIDGNHEFQHVMNDIELWSPLLVSGGWLVLHDVEAIHVDGPKRAMKELQRDTQHWNNWCIFGEMSVCRRR